MEMEARGEKGAKGESHNLDSIHQQLLDAFSNRTPARLVDQHHVGSFLEHFAHQCHMLTFSWQHHSLKSGLVLHLSHDIIEHVYLFWKLETRFCYDSHGNFITLKTNICIFLLDINKISCF